MQNSLSPGVLVSQHHNDCDCYPLSGGWDWDCLGFRKDCEFFSQELCDPILDREDYFMIPIVLKSRKGTSLVEVMTAVFISTIVILGGSFFYVASTNQINIREQHRGACRLAGQKLEELKAGDFDAIATGEVTDSISLDDLSYSRSTVAEDLGLYKKVIVTVNWGPVGREHNASLVTLIAPK
jgi:hypothetical protein